MEFSNEPEINCVFCGLGFSSVENVETHIQKSHQSNNPDHLETRKLLAVMEDNDGLEKTLKEKKSETMKGVSQLNEKKCPNNDAIKVTNNELRQHGPQERISKRRTTKAITRHQCYKCLKRFLYHSTLSLHLQGHLDNDKTKFKCDKCGSKYSTEEILRRHSTKGCVVLFHPNSDSNKTNNTGSNCCVSCQQIFISDSYLEMHQRRVCSVEVQRHSLNHPRHIVIKDASNQVRTEQKLSKGDWSGLIPGKVKHSVVSDELLESHLSDEVSTQGSQSSVNQKYHSNSPDPSLKDSISPNAVENDSCIKVKTEEEAAKDKTQHYHWHDYNRKNHLRPFKCEICKKDFSNRSSLSNHIKSHYSSRGQPFVCRDCNQRFVNLISLQDHHRDICSQKTSDTKSQMEDDVTFRPKPVYSLSNFNGVSQVPLWPNSNHNNSGSQPVTCVHCDGIFYDRLELEEHALTKHSDEQGNILCLLCERTFTTNMALRVHLTKSHGFANGGCPGVSQNLPPMPRLDSNYNISDEIPHRKRRRRLFEYDKEYTCENCHRNFSTGQALGNHRRACMNMPNDLISIENKPNHSNQNSKLHSIESLIFDNNSIRSGSFNDDKNVFLAFN